MFESWQIEQSISPVSFTFHPLVHGIVHLLCLEAEREGLDAKKVCMLEKRLLEAGSVEIYGSSRRNGVPIFQSRR